MNTTLSEVVYKHTLVLTMINPLTKFKVLSFTHSKDIMGVHIFKMGHVILAMPCFGVSCHPKAYAWCGLEFYMYKSSPFCVSFTCPGVLVCVIYYGGIYIANGSSRIFVVPLPRATIHPRVVTSESDVTQVITCSADFPAITRDVEPRVDWFVANSKSAEHVSYRQMMTLQHGVNSSGSFICSW